MLVVCSEDHDPVCWDPAQTDECWMCGRSIRVPPPDARYSEVRGDKDQHDGGPGPATAHVRARVRRRATAAKS